MKYRRISFSVTRYCAPSLALLTVLLLASCGSSFERCVEDRQNQYKKEHPDANYAELLDSRERFQKQCREESGG